MPYALCSFPMRLIAFGVSKCVIVMGNHSCQCSQRYGMDGGVYVVDVYWVERVWVPRRGVAPGHARDRGRHIVISRSNEISETSRNYAEDTEDTMSSFSLSLLNHTISYMSLMLALRLFCKWSLFHYCAFLLESLTCCACALTHGRHNRTWSRSRKRR
jgi:hypothetical protein